MLLTNWLLASLCCSASFSLTHNSSVHVSMSKNGQTATVHFQHGHEMHFYVLEAASVFANGSEIVSHTDNGEERVKAPAATMFRAIEEGRRATVRLYDDGSVTGLFQQNGAVFHVTPAHQPSSASRNGGRWLREMSKSFGDSATHIHRFEYLPPIDLLRRSGSIAKRRLRGDGADMVAITSDIFLRLGKDKEPTAMSNLHNELSTQALDDAIPRAGKGMAAMDWAGARWHPGCYPGDDILHEFQIGVILDFEVWNRHGVDVEWHIQDAIAQASLVYEMQLHIRLKIGSMKIYKSAVGAPDYARGCRGERAMVLQTKLQQLSRGPDIEFMGSTHLFTGCGVDWGAAGTSFQGTMCSKDNFAVSQVHDYFRQHTFRTFAHQLGRNFGAGHSFEDGQGTAGGPVDHRDGHLKNVVYRFNIRYRKADMCAKMAKHVGKCRGKFAVVTKLSNTASGEMRPSASAASRLTANGLNRSQGRSQEDCLTVGMPGQSRGKKCVFPFRYKDVQYHSCTQEDHHNVWCATKVDDEGKFIKGEWGECSSSPQCIRQDLCRTKIPHSSDAGPSCVFPFKYGGHEFKTCIWAPDALEKGFWCATAVDNKGEMAEWANCEKTDYCSHPWKTGMAGVPHARGTVGEQAKHKIDENKERFPDKVDFFTQIGGLFSTVWNQIQLMFHSRGKEAPALQRRKRDDNIQGKSEKIKTGPTGPTGPVPLGSRLKWSLVATAALGVVFLGAEAFVVGRALRRRPQYSHIHLEEQNEQCWLMSDVTC